MINFMNVEDAGGDEVQATENSATVIKKESLDRAIS